MMITMNLPEELILEQKEIGPLNNFIYFIGDKRTSEIAVVDPAWDVDFLCREAEKKGYKIVAVLLTHCHPDHIQGFDEMTDRYPVDAYVSVHETDDYGKVPRYNQMNKVDDGGKVMIGGIELTCMHVPGHSPGCQLFIYKNACIAGDAIFIDGCGRADLPGSNPKQMYHSLYDVILKLPDDLILFPGHNYGSTPYATLGDQKQTNPYLQADSEEDFLVQRMGFML